MHLRYMYGIQGAQRAKKPLTAHSMLLPRPGGKGKESEDMKIGFWELVVIVVIAFVFIGPDQLPEMCIRDSSNALGGAGGPLAVLIIAIVAAELGKAVSKETRIDILVTRCV